MQPILPDEGDNAQGSTPCSSCNGTGEWRYEAQLTGVPSLTVPCGDCEGPA